MKKYILLSIPFLLAALWSVAQVSVSAGTTLTASGNIHLVLNDLDLAVPGTLDATGATIHFTGNTNNAISGNGGTLGFGSLEISKKARIVTLNTSISIASQLIMGAGNIELTDKNVQLGNTGSLSGESETSHITASNGGYLYAYADLNAPNAVNIANLGATISSPLNLGTVYITRKHFSANIAAAGGKTVLRNYDIHPAVNAGLQATLSLKYLDAELNGIAENTLSQYFSTDGINFTNRGAATRDAANNLVTQINVDNLSDYTLATASSSLPLVFGGFTAQCSTGSVLLDWITLSEQNTSHFELQRSNDGAGWQVLTTVKAAGYSSQLLKYTYTDASGPAAFYRLIAFDLDGKQTFSPVIKSNCSISTGFKVMPNPVKDVAHIIVSSARGGHASLLLLNTAGQQVLQQGISLNTGANQFQLNLAAFPQGVYQLVLVQDGAAIETERIIRQ
ncbi:MAG TPA: T9SS type A sorting domain-containing protein [Chitinophagaceae bacterium]|nr:T9SS type A sorting domain-containing protein [Chitinophagaceae bacterium]